MELLVKVDAKFIEKMHKEIYQNIYKEIEKQVKAQLKKTVSEDELTARTKIITSHITTFALNKLLLHLFETHAKKLKDLLQKEGEMELTLPHDLKTRIETTLSLRIADIIKDIHIVAQVATETCKEEGELWIIYTMADLIYSRALSTLTRDYTLVQETAEYKTAQMALAQENKNHLII